MPRMWSYGMVLGILGVVFLTRTRRSLVVDAKQVEKRGEPPLPLH